MSIFSRKPRVCLDEFCRDFYTRNILRPAIAGTDVGLIYFNTVRQLVIEADSSFADIDSDVFAAEMTTLRFEVFGIAWLHEAGDKQAAAQSTFTKEYLEGEARSDIWEAMEPYNQAVARSSTLGLKADTRVGRAHLVFLNTLRMDMFEEWHKQGFDPECVSRAANRLSTEGAWKKKITPGFLMLTLCERLGCELNEEAQFRLVTTIVGLYDGAIEALNEVKIQS